MLSSTRNILKHTTHNETCKQTKNVRNHKKQTKTIIQVEFRNTSIVYGYVYGHIRIYLKPDLMKVLSCSSVFHMQFFSSWLVSIVIPTPLSCGGFPDRHGFAESPILWPPGRRTYKKQNFFSSHVMDLVRLGFLDGGVRRTFFLHVCALAQLMRYAARAASEKIIETSLHIHHTPPMNSSIQINKYISCSYFVVFLCIKCNIPRFENIFVYLKCEPIDTWKNCMLKCKLPTTWKIVVYLQCEFADTSTYICVPQMRTCGHFDVYSCT